MTLRTFSSDTPNELSHRLWNGAMEIHLEKVTQKRWEFWILWRAEENDWNDWNITFNELFDKRMSFQFLFALNLMLPNEDGSDRDGLHLLFLKAYLFFSRSYFLNVKPWEKTLRFDFLCDIHDFRYISLIITNVNVVLLTLLFLRELYVNWHWLYL